MQSDALQVDQQTGFLEARRKKVNSLDADKKLQIIEAISALADNGKWPGIHKICRALNVSPSAFYEHLELDAGFKSAYEEALLALEDHCVENLVKQGDSPNGVTANIFLLKNRWAKRWNENYQVNLNADNGQLKTILHGNQPFIDAEIVEPKQLPTEKKE